MPQDVLQQTYDAIVVGSGATGGWAAKRLSEAGLKVALLEAGRAVTAREFTEHIPSYQLKYRNHSITEVIAQALPVSMSLGFLAFAFAMGIGLPVGYVTAARRGHWSDLLGV